MGKSPCLQILPTSKDPNCIYFHFSLLVKCSDHSTHKVKFMHSANKVEHKN